MLLFGAGLAGCDRGGPPAGKAAGQNADAGSVPANQGGAQTTPNLELEARFAMGFGFLDGIREQADGSVLVADPLSEILLRIDLTSGTADTLGRPGPGPQEYKQPDRVFPLPGDTSLLVDLGKAQLTTVLPDGTFGSALPMLLPSESGLGDILHPRFVDSDGRLYHQAGRSRTEGPADSAAVVRFDRLTGVTDTVATIWLPEFPSRRSRRFGYLPKLLESRDDWAVGPDGSVAIFRARENLVDWVRPDGRRVRGEPNSFDTYPVERNDKEATLDELRSSAISSTATASRDGSVRRMTMSRGTQNSGEGPGIDDFEWSETFPAFRSDRAIVSPTGELWLQRWLPADLPSQWEIFDLEGVWMGSVELPGRNKLLGFGKTASGEEAVYMASSDEFDLKWLERYRVVR